MNEVNFAFNGHNCPVLLNEQQEPWGVTPEEDRWFRANMGNLSEEERDAFIARAVGYDSDKEEER